MNMREKVFIRNSMVEFLFWKCTFPDNSNKTVSAVSWGKNLSRNRSRFETLSGYKFNDSTDMSKIPIVPMAQLVEQQGSEALGTGSDPKPYQNFCLLKRRYIRITHPTHSQFLDSWFFWNRKALSYDLFPYCETKNCRQKVVKKVYFAKFTENNDWSHVCRKLIKTIFKTVVSFFDVCKSVKIFAFGRKKSQCQQAALLIDAPALYKKVFSNFRGLQSMQYIPDEKVNQDRKHQKSGQR